MSIDFLAAKLRAGGELWMNATIIGSYIDENGVTQPIYNLNQLSIVDPVLGQRASRQQGRHFMSVAEGLLGAKGRLEMLDRRVKLAQSVTFGKSEWNALKSTSLNGLPTDWQLGWARTIRGPQSPTIEQEVTKTETAGGDGLTFTGLTTPSAGNTLHISHIYYFSTFPVDQPVATGFTKRVISATTSNDATVSIHDKIAAGTEWGAGTQTITNGGRSADNSGYCAEISGLVNPSYVTSGFTEDSGSDVTSRSSGSADTTTPNKPDCFIIACWGMPRTNSPTGFSFSNSFALQAEIGGTPGGDTLLEVATRTVTSTSTYSSTASWTNAGRAAGCIVAYEIETTTAPVANVTADANPITYLDTATAVPTPPTVTEGTSSITSIVVSCDAGTISFTASGSVTLSNNDTSSVTLQNGASETEYNTVLATITHTRSTHGLTTFTIAPTDGTLSDSKNFTRFVSPIGVEFSGTQAQVRALIQSLGAVMDVGQTSASLVLYVEDDTSPTPLTDSQTITLSVSTNSGGPFTLFTRRRRRQ